MPYVLYQVLILMDIASVVVAKIKLCLHKLETSMKNALRLILLYHHFIVEVINFSYFIVQIQKKKCTLNASFTKQ